MGDLTEKLESLEENGRQYAHFFSHADYPAYYGIWIRECTPEYMRLWLPESSWAGYALAGSIEMPNTAFYIYIAEVFPDRIHVASLKDLYRIDNFGPELAMKLAHDFRAWNQEKIRLERAKWLQQYPWIVNAPTE